MQSLKSPYTLYNQQSVSSTLHNNLLFITCSTLLIDNRNYLAFFPLWFPPPFLIRLQINRIFHYLSNTYIHLLHTYYNESVHKLIDQQ